MDIRRKLEKDLNKWKASPTRNPLLIYGARQVGKTYLINDVWGKENFKKVIRIDLRNDVEARKLIKNYPNPEKIMEYLSLRFGTEINKDTLLFFDEIQEAIQILTAAKYFSENHKEIPVIMTGSLVRVKLAALEKNNNLTIKLDPGIEKENQDGHNNFLYPVGKIDKMNMYPLTFNEFLFAYKPALYSLLENSFLEEKELISTYHQMALDAFYIYLQIGGLPEVNKIYLTSGSILNALAKVESIYMDYLSDMSLYQISNQTIVRTKMVFENIYNQLNKENKNFKINEIEVGKRYRDYMSAFDWLNMARLAYRSELTKEKVTLPLISQNESLFRTYLPDCGLFSIESKINPASFMTSIKENTLSGIYIENYVATELVARDIPLFYWKGKTTSEFEFLLDIDNKIIPVDAKKGKGSLNSLNNFRNQNSNKLAIKVSTNKYGLDKVNGILTLPFYYLGFFLDKNKEEGKIR